MILRCSLTLLDQICSEVVVVLSPAYHCDPHICAIERIFATFYSGYPASQWSIC